MKKIPLYFLLFLTFSIQSQIISSSDAAVLFSGDDYYGTARFEALSGAFGALGGNMSAGEVNPAGMAVFLEDQSSVSLAYRKTKINTSFYENTISNNDQFINFSQAGGVMVFDLRDDENWRKVALGFNYSIVNDFDNSFIMEGNSGTPDFIDDPFLNYDSDNANDVFYNNVDNQSFINTTNGLSDRFTFSIAADYKDKLFYGISISTYNLDYRQVADLLESNNNGTDTLDASLIQTLQTTGSGFSLGFGIIAKPINALRLGLSYKSPVWYDLTDIYTDDLQIDVSNNPDSFTDYSEGIFDYKVTTPSVATGSLAFLFGKRGLLSFDYPYKDYQNTRLRPTASYMTENQDLSTNLRGVSQFRIGTEWRLEMVSLRGGYLMAQSPYKGDSTSNDLTGYSFGLGFDLGNRSKLDFAYTNTTHNQPYAFLQASDSGNLNIENQRITATVVIGF
ncbi:MAG: outer membrane protein transport protein [Flavobacteriaceae bacterium]|nr:outer membrane protein transport protein [Flavobacteriaceae bacterium]